MNTSTITPRTQAAAPVAPDELDREWAAETSPFADLDPQCDEPTPDDSLSDSTDYAEDEGPDLGEWWDYMEPDVDLDARWCLTIAGGAGSLPANEAWAAEGRARLRVLGSTRGDLHGRDTAGDGRD